VVAIVGLVTVGASIQHLRGTPSLYGVTYDLHLEATGNFADVRPIAKALRRDPLVREALVASTGVPLAVGDVQFGGEAVFGDLETMQPTILEGRLPSADDEIVLGSRTMRELHTAVGRTIDVAVVGITGPVPFRVVGRGVMAPLSDTERLGQGALLGGSAIDRLATHAPAGFQVPAPGDAFVRVRGAAASATEHVRSRLGGRAAIEPRVEPGDVATFGELQELPWLVTVLLSGLAVLTVVHLLSSSVRRRRRDLGVLQALGTVPRQLGWIVGWQAVAIAVLALAIGAPLGIAAGRVTWMALSEWAGIVPRPTVPLVLMLSLVPIAIGLALLAALAPARAASRTRPVEVLRTD
jgi:putative ABC transport system permease protein